MSKNNKKNLDDSFLKENKFIFNKYKPIKKIGKGCFGSIYSVIRMNDKSVFAMKTEKINLRKILEAEAYYLFNLQGIGIPKIISFGHTKNYYILIETLLGKSLKDILKNFISITDICLIGLQIIDRLEWIHSKNLIYRDIKPDNFLFGIDDPNVLYIIDFGLCKKYRSSKTGKHILPKMTGKFNGNFHYCSQYVIKGKESSRRDDIISLGYLLIFLLKRELPWSNIVKQKIVRAKYYEIVYLKETDGCGSLFKNIPQELATFFKYSQKLKFEEEPNYLYLRSLLNNIILNQNFNKKNIYFSWIDSNNKKLLKMPNSHSKRKSSPFMRILKSIRNKKENMTESKINTKINTIPLTARINNSLDLNIPVPGNNINLTKEISKKNLIEEEELKKNRIKTIKQNKLKKYKKINQTTPDNYNSKNHNIKKNIIKNFKINNYNNNSRECHKKNITSLSYMNYYENSIPFKQNLKQNKNIQNKTINRLINPVKIQNEMSINYESPFNNISRNNESQNSFGIKNDIPKFNEHKHHFNYSNISNSSINKNNTYIKNIPSLIYNSQRNLNKNIYKNNLVNNHQKAEKKIINLMNNRTNSIDFVKNLKSESIKKADDNKYNIILINNNFNYITNKKDVSDYYSNYTKNNMNKYI